ncbi:MAG: magnesium/cobalt transporter CorA [Bacillus sp. (in: firmicutes)]
MIKAYLYKNDETIMSDIPIEELGQHASEKATSLLWVDLFDTSLEELQNVAEIFGFHPLAIEDCLQYTLRSKVDKYDGYTFFVFNDVAYHEESEEEITTEELNVFLGHNFLVTVHLNQIPAIGKLVRKVRYAPSFMKKGPDYLLYSILDEIVDEYFPILERISERIDELEDEMYINPAQEISEEFLALKRTIVLFRRVIVPKKRIFGSIGSRYLFRVREENVPYYMDLVDHLERISESLDVFSDLVSGAMDTYFSLVSARTNDTMKKLTVITTLTALLTAITGFFGMNTPIPFQDNPVTTYVILAVVIILPLIGWLFAMKRYMK